jgi:hypothetical protein
VDGRRGVAIAAVLLTVGAYRAEAGSRAGAEPLVSALMVAVPLGLLVCVEASAAACARGGLGAGACLAVATVPACLVSGVAVRALVGHLGAGYSWYPDLAWAPLLVAALLGPLAGGWAALARTRRATPGRAEGTLGP